MTADQPDFDEMDEEGLLSSSGTGDGPSKIRMGELVKKYLQAQTLEVLREDELEDAVTRYVDKDDTDAIKECVRGMERVRYVIDRYFLRSFLKETLEGMTGGLKKNESNVDYDDASTFKKVVSSECDPFAEDMRTDGILVNRSKTRRKSKPHSREGKRTEVVDRYL